MKTNFFLISMFFLGQLLTFGQDMVTVTEKVGIENKEIMALFNFQNIDVRVFNFQNPKIKGKKYKVLIKEFKKGELTNEEVVFDGTELDFLKIEHTLFSFKAFTEISEGNLKIQIRNSKASSKASNFKISKKDFSKYTMKSFLAGRVMRYPLDKEIPLFVITTPTIHADGSGSYCQLISSGIEPNKLGEHFNIPHYFLVSLVLI